MYPIQILRLIPCVFVVFAFNALVGREVHVTPVEIWSNSTRQIDHLKVSYEMDSRPTEEVLNYYRTNSVPKKVRNVIINICSHYHTMIAITKKGAQSKYNIKKTVEPFDIDGLTKGGRAFGQSKMVADDVQIWSVTGLFFFSNTEHSGAFRSEWPEHPITPLSFLLPPSDISKVKSLKDGENLVEVRSDEGKSAIRYHLSSRYGMMPVEIEYFQVLSNGGLFLYRVVKIEKYLETKQGSYLPESGVTYEFASRDDGKLTWRVEERFKLIKSETGLDIPDSEFQLTFPPGTRVTDYTIDVDYLIPKDGKNPIFSITNPESDGQLMPAK